MTTKINLEKSAEMQQARAKAQAAKKANVEETTAATVKVNLEKSAEMQQARANAHKAKTVEDNREVWELIPGVDELIDVDEDTSAIVEEKANVEENTAKKAKSAKKKAAPPKQEKLATAKTNASGQYIIWGMYDGDGPMLYLLDNNNKKIRVNSIWAYAQIENGNAVRVDQKAIDEMKGKKAEAKAKKAAASTK